MRYLAALPACLWLVAPAMASAACVTNKTDDTLIFTIDAQTGGARTIAQVAPDRALCLPAADGAVYRVFGTFDELEGCSRIAENGEDDALLVFQRYDRCLWASQSD